MNTYTKRGNIVQSDLVWELVDLKKLDCYKDQIKIFDLTFNSDDNTIIEMIKEERIKQRKEKLKLLK